jgi:HrpA-like RNA helicase
LKVNVAVVDSGFVKLRFFNTSSLTDSLVVVPVSQASADQRVGRAGRVRPGKAYRLYTEEFYQSLNAATVPEMQRSELSGAVLQLKALGIDNVLRFTFPSPPSSASLVAAFELLHALGALDKNGELTKPLGMTMAELPTSALYSKCLLISGIYKKKHQFILCLLNLIFDQGNMAVLKRFSLLWQCCKYRMFSINLLQDKDLSRLESQDANLRYATLGSGVLPIRALHGPGQACRPRTVQASRLS